PGAQRDSSSLCRISSSTSARSTCRRTAMAALPLLVPQPASSSTGRGDTPDPGHPIGSCREKRVVSPVGPGRRLTTFARADGTAADGSPRERAGEAEVLGDDAELDLVGPLPHLQDPGVAVVAGDDVLVEEAVAAPDLAGVAGVVGGGVAAHELRDRGLLRDGQAGVEASGGLVRDLLPFGGGGVLEVE